MQIKQAFEYNGHKFKPITGRMMMAMEELQSEFKTELQAMFYYLYLTSESFQVDQLDDLTALKTLVYDFADQFTPDDINNLSELIAKQNELINGKLFEVVEKGPKKRKVTIHKKK
jgi:hypothetical protein